MQMNGIIKLMLYLVQTLQNVSFMLQVLNRTFIELVVNLWLKSFIKYKTKTKTYS